jgi:DNA recombination protein RmuC
VADLILVGLGVIAGSLAGWAVGRAQMAGRVGLEVAAIEARLARAEAREEEARRDLERRDGEVTGLRAALDGERTSRVQAETRWEAARESREAQQRLVEEARERLAGTFQALGAETLQRTQETFLALAREALDVRLGRGEAALDAAVRPLRDALDRYEAHLRELEATRQTSQGSLEEQLRTLAASSLALQRETGTLVSALRAPHVRGRWGELTLHRVVELAGLTGHCDYAEQVTADGDGARSRPDLVVHLPGGRLIVVDAKVPLAGYLDALSAATDDDRAAALARHARQLRTHMSQLAAKAYWDRFASTPELVVMFIPGEPFVAAAAEIDGALIEDGMARGVVVATPATLIALLRAIAHGWRQERVAASAARVSDLGRQLHGRLRSLAGHLAEVGASLSGATAAFNRAVGSLESRVLPAARRFRDLGAATGDEIPVVEPVAEMPRTVVAGQRGRPDGADVPRPARGAAGPGVAGAAPSDHGGVVS